MLNTIFPGNKCPKDFLKAGVPCHCPFKKVVNYCIYYNKKSIIRYILSDLQGTYSVNKANVLVKPSIKIPGWLVSGEYKIKLDLSHQGKRLICFQMKLNLA